MTTRRLAWTWIGLGALLMAPITFYTPFLPMVSIVIGMVAYAGGNQLLGKAGVIEKLMTGRSLR